MRFLNPKQTWFVSTPEDELLPVEERTVFHLRTLTVDEDTYLQDRLGSVSDDGMNIKLGSQELIAINIGLDKVETPEVDENGNPILFERDEKKAFIHGIDRKIRPWKSESLSRLDKKTRSFLAKSIIDGPKLKEAEVKN